MIDFRYHLVSLMAVLIALTMGVILGAGPLQGPLSETLTGQVDRLTQQQRQLTAANEQLRGQVDSDASFIEAIGAPAVAKTLDKVPVCVVRTAGAVAKDADRVAQYLRSAGAQLGSSIQLNESWLSAQDAKTREALAERVAGYLPENLRTGSTDAILASALVISATTGDANTKVLRDLLGAGDTPLASFSSEGGPCQSLVVVTGVGQPKAPLSPDAVSAFGKSLGALATGGVIVGDGATDGQVVTLLRQATVSVTTVDSVNTVKAAVSAPLALAKTRAGQREAYGVQTGAALVAPGANG